MALEETLLKPLQDPQNPEESWLACYAPTVEALEKIKLKRKLEELGRDVPEEVCDSFLLSHTFRTMSMILFETLIIRSQMTS